jgi:hypothetical protein
MANEALHSIISEIINSVYLKVKEKLVVPFALYFFLLAIALSVLLRYADSDYLYGIFKLFL